MFWFSFCFRAVQKLFCFGIILVSVMWGLTLQSGAEGLPIFFSTELIAQNPVKFGPRSFQNLYGQSAEFQYDMAKENFQYPVEEKIERTIKPQKALPI